MKFFTISFFSYNGMFDLMAVTLYYSIGTALFDNISRK